jgi:pyruvate formate lyase activating enzyme
MKSVAGCGIASMALQTGLVPELLGGIQNIYAFSDEKKLSSKEARFYKKIDGGGIECRLCPRHCFVTDLERGYCGVRENRQDVYYSLVYGLPCSLNVDPIEKKPLFHFYPGTTALSLATAGCNVNCKFCQNWEISQSRPEQTDNIDLPPQAAVDIALRERTPNIAYTYSEPVVFYEYMYDIAALGKDNGIRSVMITGGYIEKEPLNEIIPLMDAIKIDLKSIREEYYKNIVSGELKPVLETLIQIKNAGVWLEIVYLVVPTLNDTPEEFRDLARWIKEYLGRDVPVHFSRFHPQYLLKNLPPTPQKTLENAYDVCRAEGLNFVYLGNLPGHPAESTYCPYCGELLIERRGYRIYKFNIKDNLCGGCNKRIPGHFQ